MRVAVVSFPGSNCDRDAVRAVDDVLGAGSADLVWHEDESLAGADAVVLPGGFSYGDYLRCGAMARLAPVMAAVRRFADEGHPVLGICNGFQVLCESGLLPGALLPNASLRFHCAVVELELEAERSTAWTTRYTAGERVRLPIAHGEGRYWADTATLDELERSGRVVFRYAGANPNGSERAIAGICSAGRNVVGLMPHPERAVHRWMGSDDGLRMLTSLLDAQPPTSTDTMHEELAHANA